MFILLSPGARRIGVEALSLTALQKYKQEIKTEVLSFVQLHVVLTSKWFAKVNHILSLTHLQFRVLVWHLDPCGVRKLTFISKTSMLYLIKLSLFVTVFKRNLMIKIFDSYYFKSEYHFFYGNDLISSRTPFFPDVKTFKEMFLLYDTTSCE